MKITIYLTMVLGITISNTALAIEPFCSYYHEDTKTSIKTLYATKRAVNGICKEPDVFEDKSHLKHAPLFRIPSWLPSQPKFKDDHGCLFYIESTKEPDL